MKREEIEQIPLADERPDGSVPGIPKLKVYRRALVLPVFIRSTRRWIQFGKFTRVYEWRPDLGRYRTIWTEEGWI